MVNLEVIKQLIIHPFLKILIELGLEIDRIKKIYPLKTEGVTFYVDDKKNVLLSIDYLKYPKEAFPIKSNTVGQLFFNKIHSKEILEDITAKLPGSIKSEIKIGWFNNNSKGLPFIECTIETMEKLFQHDCILGYFQTHYNNIFSKEIDIHDFTRDIELGDELKELKDARDEVRDKVFDFFKYKLSTPDDIKRLEEKVRNETPVIKEILSRHIERGTIANKVKVLTGYKCLLCEQLDMHPYGFKKKNSEELYIESHHVTPVSLRKQGSLSVTNIITLCANHHRLMHYGNAPLLEENEVFFVFQIEGKKVEVQKIQIH